MSFEAELLSTDVAVFDDVRRIVQDDVVQERSGRYATLAGRLFDQPRI
jgi:hypothetical protein